MTNFLYNPDRKGKQQLIAEFVVRTQVFDDIMHDIDSSKMLTPEQHYLLVGQRGTGKTTLLHRIKYAIEDSKKLKNWLIPVVFSEEQYNISELANLWENLCQVLEDYHGFEHLYTEVEQHFDKENFEEIGYDILEKNLKKHKKKLVLLIDNVGDLLQKLEEKEIRRLRELMQTKSHIRFIVASPFYLDNVLDYKQPFFEFFKVKRLDGLTKEETERLLLKLGDVHNEGKKIQRILQETPERVETLRILTGGVPRTIALMFKILVDHEHESSVKDLERILDAVTPLYKHRMDDLPKQQQKIMDAVAKNWDAISVKELKEKTRLDSKTISAQLNQLEKNQVIEKRTGNTKNHLYLIKERFWNIWYLMRYGRKFDRERVLWLVKFMESWYSTQELEQRVIDFTSRIKNNELDDSVIELFGLAYTSLKEVTVEVRMDLYDNLPDVLADTVKISQDELFSAAAVKIARKKYEAGIVLLRQIRTLDESNKLMLFSLLLQIPIDVLKDNIKQHLNNFSKSILPIDILFSLFFFLAVTNVIAHSKWGVLESFAYQFKVIKETLQLLSGDNLMAYFLVGSILQSLIVTNRVNVAHEFFSGDDAEFFKPRLENSYFLIQYYRQDQDEALLLRLPDEKKHIILKEITKINKERNTFKP